MRKDIDGYGGDYVVTSQGDIISTKYKEDKVMSDRVVGHGYKIVTLYKNGTGKSFYIHRIVATHFIENPENKTTVNHKDGNKLNNSIDNLEWMTNKENNIHSFKELGRVSTWKGVTGVDNPSTKIVYMIDGRNITKFCSSADAEKSTGVNARNIRRAASGARKSAGGFKWSYDEPLVYTDEDGVEQSYMRPKKIGVFAS